MNVSLLASALVIVAPAVWVTKKGGKLKADEVCLSSLQYVKVKPIERAQTKGSDGGEKESLTVTLDNYVLLSPDALNQDEANKEKLQKVMNKDPMARIE